MNHESTAQIHNSKNNVNKFVRGLKVHFDLSTFEVRFRIFKRLLKRPLPCMWRIWVRRGEYIGSWWGNRKEGDHLADLGVDGWIILGWISRRWDVGIWTGLGWPRIETGGGRL